MNHLAHYPTSFVLVGVALPVLALAAYITSLVVPIIVRVVVPIVVDAVVS